LNDRFITTEDKIFVVKHFWEKTGTFPLQK
jgi:hypothetical protein